MGPDSREEIGKLICCHVAQAEYGFTQEFGFVGYRDFLACLHELSSHAMYWSGLPVRG